MYSMRLPRNDFSREPRQPPPLHNQHSSPCIVHIEALDTAIYSIRRPDHGIERERNDRQIFEQAVDVRRNHSMYALIQRFRPALKIVHDQLSAATASHHL